MLAIYHSIMLAIYHSIMLAIYMLSFYLDIVLTCYNSIMLLFYHGNILSCYHYVIKSCYTNIILLSWYHYRIMWCMLIMSTLWGSGIAFWNLQGRSFAESLKSKKSFSFSSFQLSWIKWVRGFVIVITGHVTDVVVQTYNFPVWRFK